MNNFRYYIKKSTARFFEVVGPVVLSAFSLFVAFSLLQPIALWLDPTFSLLANRGTGKIAFTVLVLLNILLLVTTTSRVFLQKIIHVNLGFFKNHHWLKPFFTFFTIAFIAHSLLLYALSFTSFVQINPQAISLITTKWTSLIWGFIATFFLAWTEEMIFRGTLFMFFNQKLKTLTSITLTSLIFMLAHNLTNPLKLISDDWQLGVGLFLLGMILNVIFAISNKLYIGMGVHAGLVFVKVFLRRIPMIDYSAQLPWWFSPDLRQSSIVHLAFFILLIILIVCYKKALMDKQLNQQI
jgi:membrane protease YdiL (CAAX protease family)